MTDGRSPIEPDFEPEDDGLREALCTLGNRYFAIRCGAPETTADGAARGHVLGGFADPTVTLVGSGNAVTIAADRSRRWARSAAFDENWLARTD